MRHPFRVWFPGAADLVKARIRLALVFALGIGASGCAAESPNGQVSGGNEVLAPGEISGARYVLRTINGRPIGQTSGPEWCPTVLEGTLVFEGWPDRASGPVAMRHRVRTLNPNGLPTTTLAQDTAVYLLRDGALELHDPSATRTFGVFSVEQNGARLRTTTAYCYPGQKGVRLDITVELVYERED